MDQFPEIADEVITLARVRNMQNQEVFDEIFEAIEYQKDMGKEIIDSQKDVEQMSSPKY